MSNMALTREQFMDLRAKGLSVEQIRRFESGEQPQSSTSGETKLRETKPIRDTFSGLAKSAGSTLLGLGELGRSTQSKVLPFTMKGNEGQSIFDKGNETNLKLRDAVTAKSRGEQVAKFVGDAAQYAIPSNSVAKATKGLGLAKMIIGRALTGGTVTAVQTGEFGKEAGIAATLEGLSGPAGIAFSKLSSKMSTSLPEWLVRPLLKQSKDAKAKGQDVAGFLVDSGRIGSADDLITKSQSAIDDISKQVDDILRQQSDSGIQVSKNTIAKEVADSLNDAGAAVDEKEILDIIERLSPQAKGLLKKNVLTVAEANKLRSSIDRTLGDRGFLRDQLPFNKEVLRSFTNALRGSVKSADERLVPLFDDYAKNIRLRNALIDQASSGVAKNSLGIYDLLTGVGAFGATGNPVLGVAAVGGRRAFESGAVKTTLAQVFKNTDKVTQLLSQAAPAERAVIMQFINSLSENKTSIDQQQPKE